MHISPPADYRAKSGVEHSGRRMGDWIIESLGIALLQIVGISLVV